MNQKGIDQIEIDFFGKFIFMSNNEDNFIIASEYDERFWVRRVPKFKEERKDLLQLMIEEIPDFLHYLNKRKLANEDKGRMYFDKEGLKTDALKKLIVGNKPAAEKEIRHFIRTMMVEHGFAQLKFTGKYIFENVVRKKWDNTYIERILHDNLKVAAVKKSTRYKFPVLRQVFTNGNYEEQIVLDSGNGKPYIFNAIDFLTAEEIETLQLCDEAKKLGQDDYVQDSFTFSEVKDDLPF